VNAPARGPIPPFICWRVALAHGGPEWPTQSNIAAFSIIVLKKLTLLPGRTNSGGIAEKLGHESTPFELFSIKPVRISQRQKEAGITRHN